VNICQHVRSSRTGARVIEALASGIPTINTALDEYDLPPAHYIDSGMRFTVVLHQRSADTTADREMTAAEARVYRALGSHARTAAELADDLRLSPASVRKNLRGLANRGLVTQFGGRGQPTVYRRDN
jgi:ATP-dependent DNA helicase RecG